MLEIRSRLPQLIGNKASLLEEVKNRLTTTDRITKASAANIPRDNIVEHINRVTVVAACVRCEMAATPLIDNFVTEVSDTYELDAGPRPDSDSNLEVTGDWLTGLDEALETALEGDPLTIVGPGRISEVITECNIDDVAERGRVVSELAKMIFDPRNFETTSNAFVLEIGVHAADITELVAHVHSLPSDSVELTKPMEFPIFRERLVAKVRELIAADFDMLDLDMHLMNLTDAEDAIADGAAFALGFTPAANAKSMVAAMRQLATKEGAGWKDQIINEAMDAPPSSETTPNSSEPSSTPTEPTKPGQRTTGAKNRRTSAQVKVDEVSRESGITGTQPAATDGQLLRVIQDNAKITEADLGALLGISRAQMINYRDGKTPWNMTPEQRKALRDRVNGHVHALNAALSTIGAS